MAWLLREGDVLAAVQVVESRRGRGRALAGLQMLDGAILLRRRPLMVTTLRAGIAVDVAYCDRDLLVRATVCLGRVGVTRCRFSAASVIVARGGAFERWGLVPGDLVEVKGG